MRALVLAIAALALLAAPANAQMGGGKRGADHAPAPEKPKIDEKAYKAALERVPTPKEKYDPWGGVAPAPAAATAAKKK
ncbi:hypothetical protein [Tardiphaga sp. P9-11]|jgi:hypothetical protein|uniref:hypothetical protein n=1 Tax=Tardiphaga sp. P9-11 TaxID=2024614 RepID=UPI0011F1C92E|nr:hypothetical protein [Tardiphaga sp. P9-11]KAA0076676.1 hypothetical protein CIW50_10850 [Tardiphaga sp. P9-11]